METEEGQVQTWHVCVLIPSLSLYSSCSGHLVLSMRVFLYTASIFTAKKVCKDFGERELLYAHPCVLQEMDIRSFH